MIRLVAIELRRMWARRLFKAVLILAFVGIVLPGVIVFAKHQKPDPRVVEAIDEQRKETVARCLRGDVPAFQGDLPLPENVPAQPLPPPGSTEDPREFRRRFCRAIGVQTFGVDPGFALTSLSGIFGGTLVPLILVGWVLGATFIGAEWRAGTVTTWLTWVPRRTRLLLAKAVTVMAVAFVLTILFHAALGGALLPSALARGTTAGADSVWFRDLVGLVLRGAALAAMGAAIGFTLGQIGRNSAAALGAGFVYLAVIEGGLLGGIFPNLRRWLIVGNSIVFVSGRKEAGDVFGRTTREAGILLGLYTAAALVIALASFRARDVT